MENDQIQKRAAALAYAQQVGERRKALEQARKTSVPNLADADALYDPAQNKATLSQLTSITDAVEGTTPPGGQKQVFSEATINGLREAAAAREKMEQAKAEQVEPKTMDSDESGATGGGKVERTEEEQSILSQFPGLAAAAEPIDLSRNRREREAVAKRVQAIDLNSGLMNGDFRQVVPIVPDRLVVEYRTPTPVELQHIQAILFKRLSDNPALEFAADSLQSLMTLTAAIVSINGRAEPVHMVGQSMYTAEFNQEVFEGKLNRLMRMPGPLVYTMTVHYMWFMARVNELFTTESLKNG